MVNVWSRDGRAHSLSSSPHYEAGDQHNAAQNFSRTGLEGRAAKHIACRIGADLKPVSKQDAECRDAVAKILIREADNGERVKMVAKVSFMLNLMLIPVTPARKVDMGGSPARPPFPVQNEFRRHPSSDSVGATQPAIQSFASCLTPLVNLFVRETVALNSLVLSMARAYSKRIISTGQVRTIGDRRIAGLPTATRPFLLRHKDVAVSLYRVERCVYREFAGRP
ncbi:hypothetical protein [Rhizobium sp. P007]|uniref:hypothetical protein n=1 Tax=Rhizobium sp. P007 TaxID=285908 RepID=UPI001159B517|nr:hypothetical protein [Rhizobium sp. P007]CAD7058588.1 hypothetical protein RP007_02592 [Rhizobium sp. P007]